MDTLLAPLSRPRLHQGDSVYAKGHGWATVLQPNAGVCSAREKADGQITADATCSGRAALRLTEGSRAGEVIHASVAQLSPVIARRGRALLLCAETADFRAAAKSQIHNADVVLEIGCSFGDATEIIASRSPRVCALDVSRSVLFRAKSRLPAIRFEMIDALAHFSRVVRLAAELRPSVVFCDVGGNRDGATVALLLARMQSELKVELTVVKNRDLHRAALRHAARRRDRECMKKQLPLEASALVTNSLPDAEIFWATQLARAVLRDHNLGMPIDDCEELNIACDSEQERRLCFEFANTGRCTRRRCTFRHLPHEHPDAVADLARRKAQAESIGSTQG